MRMLRLEFERRQVVQAHMWADRVVVSAPGLDDDSGFGAIAKPLDAETFIAEFAVKGLIGTVLPRLARIDDGGIDLIVGEPLQDCMANEFWSAIRAQECRCTMAAYQAGQNIDDPRGTNTPGDIDLQAFMGKFIDHGQTFELLAVGTGVEDEIVGPDMIGSQRC